MRWLVPIALLGILAAGAAVVIFWPKHNPPADSGPIVASKSTIFDLSADAAELLRGLPGVSHVDAVAVEKPTKRIIHLLDYHYVPRDLYALDFKAATGKELTDDDYNRFLDDVESVQADHAATIDALVGQHGLKSVSLERLTVANFNDLLVPAALIKEQKPGQVKLAQMLGKVRAMLADSAEGEKRQLLDMEKEILDLQQSHRRLVLEWGAAFILHLDGKLDGVVPLDDAKFLAAANPVKADGTIKADPDAVAGRERAMVVLALQAGKVVVIVCGGSHDLTDAVQLRAGEDCEYIRVAGPAYERLSRGGN